MPAGDRRLQLGLTLVEVMVNPLRPFLLNAQIKLEARKVAHAATKTCKPRPTEENPEPSISGDDDDHTMNVKLASLQPSLPRQHGDVDDGSEQTGANTDTAS